MIQFSDIFVFYWLHAEPKKKDFVDKNQKVYHKAPWKKHSANQWKAWTVK